MNSPTPEEIDIPFYLETLVGKLTALFMLHEGLSKEKARQAALDAVKKVCESYGNE